MITRPHLNLALRLKILELLKEGVGTRKLAQFFGLSRRTVWRLIKLQQASTKQ